MVERRREVMLRGVQNCGREGVGVLTALWSKSLQKELWVRLDGGVEPGDGAERGCCRS